MRSKKFKSVLDRNKEWLRSLGLKTVADQKSVTLILIRVTDIYKKVKGFDQKKMRSEKVHRNKEKSPPIEKKF